MLYVYTMSCCTHDLNRVEAGSEQRELPACNNNNNYYYDGSVHNYNALNRHIDGHHKLIKWKLVIHGGMLNYVCVSVSYSTDGRSPEVTLTPHPWLML